MINHLKTKCDETRKLIRSAAVAEDLQEQFVSTWETFTATGRFPDTTKSQYSRTISRYLTWALKAHAVAVPATQETLEAFSSYCMRATDKLSTYQAMMVGPTLAHSYAGVAKPPIGLAHRWDRDSKVRLGELKQPEPAAVLTTTDFNTLMGMASDGSYQDRIVVLSMLVNLETGCRASDATQLRWDTTTEYPDGGISVKLPRSKRDQLNKGSRKDISAGLVAMLVRLYRDFDVRNPTYLLPHKDQPKQGYTPGSLVQYISRFSKEHGLDMSSHSARRGFVAAAVRYGIHPMEIASYMGCSLANVSRYARSLPNEQSPARLMAQYRSLELRSQT